MACDSCSFNMFDFILLISQEERLLQFLQEHGVLGEHVMCPKCNKACTFYPEDSFRFKCTNSSVVIKKRKKVKVKCPFSISLRKGTFFGNSNLSIQEICKFVAFWLYTGYPKHEKLERECHFSSATVVDWANLCREVCLFSMIDDSERIGGVEKIVELDEVKMSKRKYNRDRVKESQWVFGGFERNSKKFFFVPVVEKSKETLLTTIKKWILPGTTIYSECWKSYDCLQDEGFQQATVNHSLNFIDHPDNGTHTQHIECFWRDVQRKNPNHSDQKKHVDGYLAEFLFRRKYPDHRDQFHHFFKYMGMVYPPGASSSHEEALENST